MSRRSTVAASATLLVLAAGCGGPAADRPPSPEPSTSRVVTPSGPDRPSSTATPTPAASVSPSPSPTRAPDARQDRAAAAKALVTAADLGSPWVAGKQEGNAAEACPGRPSAVEKLPFLSSERRYLVEGRDELVNGADFRVDTLAGPDAAAVRDAWAADTKACREHADAFDYSVVLSEADGPRSADDADEIVFSRVERIYFDESRDQLAYARQIVVARTNRVITTVRYTFLTDDPEQADDFTRTSPLLAAQLAKVAEEFPE